MDLAGELLLGLMVAVAALATVARLVNVPYPILLVLGGLALGFVPGLPDVELEPDLVLVLVLPPLLYSAAFFSSLRDLQGTPAPDLDAGDRPGGADHLPGGRSWRTP